MRRLALPVLLIALVAAAAAPSAQADADPASDVLLGENVFYPYNPPVSASLQAALNAKVGQAHRARFPIKVALIATPVDLGAIPTFFGKPQQYAAFLDQEITFATGRVPLLVVMPNGYGGAGLSSGAKAVLDSLPRPASGSSNALAQAALAAVPKLAAASGHPLAGTPTGSATGGGGGGAALPVAILPGVCVVVAAVIIVWRRRRPVRAATGRGPQTPRRRG